MSVACLFMVTLHLLMVCFLYVSLRCLDIIVYLCVILSFVVCLFMVILCVFVVVLCLIVVS